MRALALTRHMTVPRGTWTRPDTEGQGDADAVRQELAEMRQRMAVIKHEVTVEVDRDWVSPWRTPETFDLKVKTRLSGHREYRSLQERVRYAKASLALLH